MDDRPILDIQNLQTNFFTRQGVTKAVDNLSYSVNAGETLAIVGESGCGKSVSSLSILRLIPDPPGKIIGGAVLFEGEDLTQVSNVRMREIRGNEISMIFQEPMSSLNPMMTIGNQINESLIRHFGISKKEALDKAEDMLNMVQIPDATKWLRGYPHEMSGGMCQRVMIAMAICCNPKILIADEPTTALDVTIQAQILNLMKQLQGNLNTAIVFITHDLGVVAEIAQKAIVMYAGKKVEEATVKQLFSNPRHPYTVGLMSAIPHLDNFLHEDSSPSRLNEIPGVVPRLYDLPPGCSFANRCTHAVEQCRHEKPAFEEKSPGHWAACWKDLGS